MACDLRELSLEILETFPERVHEGKRKDNSFYFKIFMVINICFLHKCHKCIPKKEDTVALILQTAFHSKL
jgi:hypothetical protein